MQTNGNLVLYSASQAPLWVSETAGHPGAFALLDRFGRVEIRERDGRVLFATASAGRGAARLEVQDDAAAVLFTSRDDVVWASDA
jgi:hypothetical protein